MTKWGSKTLRGRTPQIPDPLLAPQTPPRLPQIGDQVLYCHHFDGRDLPSAVLSVTPLWERGGHWVVVQGARGSRWSVAYDATGHRLEGWRYGVPAKRWYSTNTSQTVVGPFDTQAEARAYLKGQGWAAVELSEDEIKVYGYKVSSFEQ